MIAENQELTRARAAIKSLCDIALVTAVPTVTYVSGYEVPHTIGPVHAAAYSSAFAVFMTRDAPTWLAAATFNAAIAREQSRFDHLLTFSVFDSFQPTDPRRSYLDAVRGALQQAGLARAGTLGIEGRTLPQHVAAFIADTFPHVKLVEVGHLLERARFVKTPREIELLRRAAHIGDVGQRALGKFVQTAGHSEFQLWAGVIERMSAAAGHDVIVIGDLATGPRTTVNNNPGGPRNRITEPGDGVYMDISTRLNGYWSDCTNGYIVGGGEPTALQKKYIRVSQQAFDAGLAALKPGVRASDVWAAANTVYSRYGMEMPHYMGHQLGVTVNELPRLVPHDHTLIEPNMVFTLEPGAYEGPGGTFGIRSEKIVRVTESGAEPLSEFEWGIKYP